jgi:hypothetical protein
MNRITRVEVIDENGRSYVNWEENNDITVSYQDDGMTLKVFVNTMESKSPAEKAYYSVYGWYPPTTSSVSNYEDNRWRDFQNGYNASKVSETPQEPTEITLNLTLEELKQIDKFVELNDETQPLFDKIRNAYPKPETLYDVIRNLGYSVDMCDEIVDAVEEFEKSKEKEMIKRNLKTSLQELANGDVRPIDDVVRETKNQQESWMDKPVEELVAILEKNPPDCLKFVMGKTLEQIIERWWCDTFTGTHEKWSMEECIDDLIDQIELFLPRSQSAEGTQSVYTEVAVEAHNELLQKIKSKLRNKK